MLAYKYQIFLYLGRVPVNMGNKSSVHAESTWFNDGSRIKDGYGDGFYGGTERTMFQSASVNMPVFQAEILTVMACARNILSGIVQGKRIAIYSNSQAAIKALGSYQCNSKLTWDCI